MAWSAFSGGFEFSTWEQTSANRTMEVQEAYVTTGNISLLLPATAKIGDAVQLTNGSGNFTVTQNADQTIHFGAVDTTTGAGGSVSSVSAHCVLKLVCTVENLEWTVEESIGNFNIV